MNFLIEKNAYLHDPVVHPPQGSLHEPQVPQDFYRKTFNTRPSNWFWRVKGGVISKSCIKQTVIFSDCLESRLLGQIKFSPNFWPVPEFVSKPNDRKRLFRRLLLWKTKNKIYLVKLQLSIIVKNKMKHFFRTKIKTGDSDKIKTGFFRTNEFGLFISAPWFLGSRGRATRCSRAAPGSWKVCRCSKTSGGRRSCTGRPPDPCTWSPAPRSPSKRSL